MTQLIDLGKLRFYFAGVYNPSTTYEVNDVVKYGGNVYIYISVISTSGNEPTDTAYWSLMLEGLNFLGQYIDGTPYKIGDGVAHGGTVYIAIQDSTSITPPNGAYWSTFVDGIDYRGAYSNSATYAIHDIVTYGGRVYIAKVDTSGNLPTNATYWDKLVDGISASGVYNDATAYVPGQTVAYGANTYVCTAETTGNVPTNTSYWSLFTGGIAYRGDWATTTQYYPNDVVNRGGKTYICLLANISSDFSSDLAALKWEIFNGGVRVTGDFEASTPYLAGDLVFDGVNTYIANQEFTSGVSVAADSDKWSLFAKGADYLPGQVGNAGKLLGTNGTAANWTYDVTKLYVGDHTVTPTPEQIETNDGLTNAAMVISSKSTDFTQIAFSNQGTGPGSSADVIVYGNNGTNDYGFIDMGFTNASFNAALYGITNPGDGYIFVSGVSNITKSVTNAALTSNVATLTTSGNHGFVSGATVIVTGINSIYNGTFTILDTPALNTFRYARVNANQSSASVSGSAVQVGGTGNLVLATDSTGSANRIVFAAGGYASGRTQMQIIPDTTVQVNISTASTSATTGALTIAGGVGITGSSWTNGDVHIGGVVYSGDNTATSWGLTQLLTAPAAVFEVTSADNTYGQFALHNKSTSSSVDFIAYPDNGNDAHGWIDMGMTGSTFSSATYGITGPNDGYIFVDAPTSSTGKGNLVLATGNNGTANQIIFAAGGFVSGHTQMTITPDQSVKVNISTPSISPTTGAFQVVGGVGIQGDVNIAGTIKFGGSGTTVSTANLAVTDPLIFTGTDNPQNNFELGIINEYALVTALNPSAVVTTAVISQNVATLGFASVSGGTNFRVNDSVTVTGINSTFNGTYTVTAQTATSVSYAKTASDVTLTGLSGAVSATAVYRPKWAGFVKNHTTGVWNLISNIGTKPSSGAVSFSGVTYDAIQTGNITAPVITATTNVVAPYVTLSNAAPTNASDATRKDYVDSLTFMHPFMMAAL